MPVVPHGASGSVYGTGFPWVDLPLPGGTWMALTSAACFWLRHRIDIDALRQQVLMLFIGFGLNQGLVGAAPGEGLSDALIMTDGLLPRP